MDQNLVSQFKHKYETLAGIVHIAENEDAAAAVVLQILKEAQCQRVALGALPDSLFQPIETVCAWFRLCRESMSLSFARIGCWPPIRKRLRRSAIFSSKTLKTQPQHLFRAPAVRVTSRCASPSGSTARRLPTR
jgi:hypothetical protein